MNQRGPSFASALWFGRRILSDPAIEGYLEREGTAIGRLRWDLDNPATNILAGNQLACILQPIVDALHSGLEINPWIKPKSGSPSPPSAPAPHTSPS